MSGDGFKVGGPAMIERIRIGNHTVSFEHESGLIHLAHVGTMDGQEMTAIADEFASYRQRFFRGEPPYIVVDNRKATGFTNDARHALSRHELARDEVCAALWGASFAIRTVINLVFKALALATSSKSVAMAVATEAEARAWLTEQRENFRGRRTKGAA